MLWHEQILPVESHCPRSLINLRTGYARWACLPPAGFVAPAAVLTALRSLSPDSPRCTGAFESPGVGRGSRRCRERTARPSAARSRLTWRAPYAVECGVPLEQCLPAGGWVGAHWGGGHCRPGPARVCSSRCRQRPRWRAGRPSQHACRRRSGGGCPGRGGRRVRCPPWHGHAGYCGGDSRGQARHVPRLVRRQSYHCAAAPASSNRQPARLPA
jgi:hypothetical protein